MASCTMPYTPHLYTPLNTTNQSDVGNKLFLTHYTEQTLAAKTGAYTS